MNRKTYCNEKKLVMNNGSKIFAKCFDTEGLTRILETANTFPDKQRNTLNRR